MYRIAPGNGTARPGRRISCMTKNEAYRSVWANPKHPLKQFGNQPMTVGMARSMAGEPFVRWALETGLLEEREAGVLQLTDAGFAE